MPSRARLDEFIAVVESGDHAGAIERYYTEDATMQENLAPPRVGRDLLVAHERAALARMSHVTSKCVSSVVEGDRVALHWNFELVAATWLQSVTVKGSVGIFIRQILWLVPAPDGSDLRAVVTTRRSRPHLQNTHC
jgi:SnoaL-like domain